MDNILKKIEYFTNNQIEQFEKNPLKSGFKLLIIYIILKKILK